MNEDETMIHRRRIIIWIITVAIIVATLFGVGKFISYRTMPPFATERNALKTSYRLMFCAFSTYGLLIMTLTYFQALGRAKLAGFLVVFRQLALVVPMVLLLPALMGGNVLGVWLALPLNDVIILVVAVVLLMREYRLLNNRQKEIAG